MAERFFIRRNYKLKAKFQREIIWRLGVNLTGKGTIKQELCLISSQTTFQTSPQSIELAWEIDKHRQLVFTTLDRWNSFNPLKTNSNRKVNSIKWFFFCAQWVNLGFTFNSFPPLSLPSNQFLSPRYRLLLLDDAKKKLLLLLIKKEV